MPTMPTRIAAEDFLASLAAHGVDFLFANPGTDFPPIVEAYARAAATKVTVPRAVMAPHENLAVAMAHGAYLMTGRAQAVMVHVNVGTANTINMLANLARDNVPLLLCAGRTPITEHGAFGARNRPIHWAQEMFDQAGMVRELVKWDYEFKAPGRIDAVVARALEVSNAYPKGPVYLTLPREPLSAPVQDAALMPPRALAEPPLASTSTVLQKLSVAERPVIVVGHVGGSAIAVQQLAELASMLAIPVVQANTREMCLGADHEMNFGTDGTALLKDADLVLVVECDAPWNTPAEGPPDNAFVVQVGVDPAFQRYPMRTFRADHAVATTAEWFFENLRTTAHGLMTTATDRIAARRARLTTRMTERRAALNAAAAGSKDRITPAALSRAIGDMAGADGIIFNEYPLQLDQAQRSKPGTYFGLSPAGGLGWALGAAIGAKMAAPDKLMIAVMGDGAYIFANPTACHWMQQAADAPVLTVIFNNSRYGAVRRATQSMFGAGAAAADNFDGLAGLSPSPPFHEFVRAQGGFGEQVERPEDLAPALARAKRAVTEDKKQALLNVICPY